MTPTVLAVIMGGGRGTRLYPLTKERCKPAVPLAGKYRLVDIPISNCLNSGINRIYLLTQFNTASLHRHIQESYKFDPFGGGFVDILSAEQTEYGETWYQGTADAVRQNLHHFNDRQFDLVLILSGDQLYRMDFRKLVNQHMQTGADVTIAAKAMPVDEVEGLGLMRVDNDLSIKEFVEKPKDPKIIENLAISAELTSRVSSAQEGKKYCLASMGIYLFRKEVLREVLSGSEADFGKEIIPSLLGRSSLSSYIFDGYWEDIGTVRAFFDCNLQLTDIVPKFNFFDSRALIYTHARYLPASKINRCSMDQVIIADGCILTNVDLKRCVIGVRALIEDGTTLENCVVMGADYFESATQRKQKKEEGIPQVGIGKRCVIRNAIIDKNARIGDDVCLDPARLDAHYQKNGVFVRDGVLVVAKNAVVPNGTRLGAE
jgi:glucose-1-phosphate adenylyltransferase